MYSPRVDIIIPCYNMAQYLPQAIDSALAQTYSPICVLVVDDGSTEDIRSLVETYEGKVGYLRQENKGQAAARNAGIAHTDGEFVCFLDADDILLPDKTAIQVAFLKEHPLVDLVHGQALNIADNAVNQPFAECRPYGDWEDYLVPLSILCPFAIHSALMRRSSFLVFGGFAEFMRGRCEDWAFWCNCVLNGAKFEYQPDMVCLYRKHAGSESSGVRSYARNEHFWMPLMLELYQSSDFLTSKQRELLVCGIRFIATKQLEIGEIKSFTDLNTLASQLQSSENMDKSAGIEWLRLDYPASIYYLLLANELSSLGYFQLAGYVFLHSGDSRLLLYDAEKYGLVDELNLLIDLIGNYLEERITTLCAHSKYELYPIVESGDSSTEFLHKLRETLPDIISFESYLYHQLGLLAQIDGALTKSIEYFKRAVMLNPFFWEHQEYLLRALSESGAKADISFLLKKILSTNESSVHGLYFTAKNHINQFRFIDAVRCIQKAFYSSRFHLFRNIYIDIEQFLLRRLGVDIWRIYKLTVKSIVIR